MIIIGGIDGSLGNLARFTSYVLSTSVHFQDTMGTPIEPQMYWLDIDFPDGPPPEYERSGYDNPIEYIGTKSDIT
jgi:hypothetical protein